MRKKLEEDFLELKVMVMFLYIACFAMILFTGHRTGVVSAELANNTAQIKALTQMYFRLNTHTHERHENDEIIYKGRTRYDFSAEEYDNCESALQEQSEGRYYYNSRTDRE